MDSVLLIPEIPLKIVQWQSPALRSDFGGYPPPPLPNVHRHCTQNNTFQNQNNTNPWPVARKYSQQYCKFGFSDRDTNSRTILLTGANFCKERLIFIKSSIVIGGTERGKNHTFSRGQIKTLNCPLALNCHWRNHSSHQQQQKFNGTDL